jgi:DNA-binding NarL/FixJ family response regulator
MLPMQPKTILLADAQFLVRAGLRCILAQQTDIQVVGEAATEQELLQQLEEHCPDMLIIDYNSPKRFGREIICRGGPQVS